MYQIQEKGEDLQNLLIRYANERLLYRLSESEHKAKFMLKDCSKKVGYL